MGVVLDGSWARGWTHMMIFDNKSILPERDGREVAAQLFSMKFNDFCDRLQHLLDCDQITPDRADKIYLTYANRHEGDYNEPAYSST
jgi:hypothetical protein